MVEVEIKAKFLNHESTNDGDIFEIQNEGEYKMDKVSWTPNEVKRLHIPVLLKDETLDWTPWDSDISKCAKVWGTNTKMWVCMKGRITNDGKKMIISPIAVTKI